MGVYKKIQCYGGRDKGKLKVLVREYFQNKDVIGDTFSPRASTRTLKYFVAYASQHKARVQQLDFIRALLKDDVHNRVFLN